MERLILLELCPALVLFVDVKHPKENSHTNETKNGRRDIETDSEIYREHVRLESANPQNPHFFHLNRANAQITLIIAIAMRTGNPSSAW
jgi:hypothetical protein